MENTSTGMHQFQLTDANGKSHSYVVAEHPAGEGMELMYALLGLGAPAVLGLAGAALKSSDMLGAVIRALSGGDSGVSNTAEMGKLAADLDFASVGAEIGKALGTGRAPDLTRRILSRTHRDGRNLGADGGIDLSYQANYAELLVAVWRVCTINRFFPVPSTSPSSSAARATPGLEGSLPGG